MQCAAYPCPAQEAGGYAGYRNVVDRNRQALAHPTGLASCDAPHGSSKIIDLKCEAGRRGSPASRVDIPSYEDRWPHDPSHGPTVDRNAQDEKGDGRGIGPVSYTHLRAHETDAYVVCRL